MTAQCQLCFLFILFFCFVFSFLSTHTCLSFLCVHFIRAPILTAIAAAVFGAPAVPYVIPCTILRRIRLFRETLSPSSSPSSSSPSSAAAFSQPVSSVISGLMTDRQKLLIGNFILGTSSSGSSSSSSSSSIFKR